ncbi:MAG: circularly permuted type 2 ATP-grasp protein [Bryobacteraceae bacterium]
MERPLQEMAPAAPGLASGSNGYRAPTGHYDEFLAAEGVPRSHWRRLAATMIRMGEERLTRRWLQAQQIIQANGISYNVYGDPQGSGRPWPLDPVPLVVRASEWAAIESAVSQRVELLNAVLDDFLGEQRLLKQRGFPPELLFRNPAFLRPFHGLPAPAPGGGKRGVRLIHYAADIARSPDGRWWVIADRTQAPSGMGYALENRLVSAQMLPEAFQAARVRRLARFFQGYREGLLSLAKTGRDAPRVVLLTPGPFNETYFEHAYLAKYLGLPLVEGADLSVRDNRVYLKTLSGLSRIDVILRRQDDSFCDPLELRGDSLLGVAGLVGAVRAGEVAIANGFGSGMLESPANMAFLPGFSREIEDRELAMPSIATWWCGQPHACRYVLDNLERLVIKAAFPKLGSNPVFGAAITAKQREDLRTEILRRPEDYVGQEPVALSSAPAWTGSSTEARHVVLRVFAAWSGSRYEVMPGGLTRVAAQSDSLVVNMQRGGGSKDTWVLSEHDEEPIPLMPAVVQRVDTSRGADLPSRVADNLFWLGRYMERIEGETRLARALMPALSGECDLGPALDVEAAVMLMAAYEYLPGELTSVHPLEQRRWLEKALGVMLFEGSRPGGLSWTAKQVGRLGWQLRERLSSDTSQLLGRVEKEFQRTRKPPAGRMMSFLPDLDRAVQTLSAFNGMVNENMTRGHGWRFLDIGRRIERALLTSALLRHCIVGGPAPRFLESLLQVADSTMTYRARYYTAMQTDLVLDLLLHDGANPRSVAFQLETLAGHWKRLPERHDADRYPLDSRTIWKMLTGVRMASAEELGRDTLEARTELSTLLDSIHEDLELLADTLAKKYLAQVEITRRLGRG